MTENASTAEPVVQVRGVSRSYGSVRALANVNWTVRPGGIHGLVGPNGAGKTTLLSVVCGFLPADAGTVHLFGQEVSPQSPPSAGSVGVLPQDATLPHRQTIGRVLAYYGRLMGLPGADAETEAERVLALVGLPEVYSRRPRTLSHGMFKRVGIAQAMIGRPPMVLLDEPTAGLDPNAARDIRALLRELRTEGTIVVSSHNLAEIEDLCSEVTILHQGTVARQDTIEGLVGAAHEVSFRLTAPPGEAVLSALLALPATNDVRWDGGADRLRIFVDPSCGTAAEASQALIGAITAQGSTFVDMQIGARLEDRFTEETA